MIRGLAVACLAATLAACAGSTDTGDRPPSGETDREVVEVVEDVDYYGACGDEILELGDGRRYWPLTVEEQQQRGLRTSDEEAAATIVLAASAQTFVHASPSTVLAVAPPGPGDDTGTLTIYDSGLARFDSDSGWLIWLDDTERTYEFAC